MNLAEKIQDLRKKNGLSQEQLAEQLDISRQAISKWESEQSTPDIDKIVLMSEFFKVSTDYLLKQESEATEESIAKEAYTIEDAENYYREYFILNFFKLHAIL